MLRCKVCKVPLSGFLSKLARVLCKVKPSTEENGVCSKCADKPIGEKNKVPLDHLKGKKYECKICKRMIHEEHSLEHVKAEEYLIELIRKDHSNWQHKDPTCKECIEYYRKLVKETEI
ncbi:MAG: hypothetical protein K9L86_08440 [Candidatus Omnitrophica bacterium]|nr:hypothetical protein [Candidatus Omnitrophota bacterium]